jgi:membrane fusion protein (multidrug efflux system)
MLKKYTPTARVCLLALLFVVVLMGFQRIKGAAIQAFMQEQARAPIAVTTAVVEEHAYQDSYRTMGLIEAVQGAVLSADSSGLVRRIHKEPGAHVHTGEVILELDAEQEKAQYEVLHAAASLDLLNYKRAREQFQAQALARSALDSARAQAESSSAQLKAQAVAVEKKTVRAPFDGRLGLFLIQEGAYTSAGAPLVSLESFAAMRVRFYIPQRMCDRVDIGQHFRVLSYTGEVYAVDPLLNSATGMCAVEGRLHNDKKVKTLSGVRADLFLSMGPMTRELMIPKAAIGYHSYGNTVYRVEKDAKGVLRAHSVFIETGEGYGDAQIVRTGLRQGDTIVTEGGLNLFNGAEVYTPV